MTKQRITLTVTILLTLVMGFIDFLTGFEISFAFFYLIPVSIAAWFGGVRAAIGISIACAITWQAANQLAGETFSRAWISYWNAVTRLGFFFTVSILLSRIKRDLEIQSELAERDPLTGAVNRRAFRESVAAEISRQARHRHAFSIAYFDLDHFKQVNDQRGHSEGDLLLQDVVATIQANLRASDVGARVGGDEFALLLPETDADQARAFMARLQAALDDSMKTHDWPVTFSIGVVTFGVPPKDVDEALRIADEQMYAIKRTSRNDARFLTFEG